MSVRDTKINANARIRPQLTTLRQSWSSRERAPSPRWGSWFRSCPILRRETLTEQAGGLDQQDEDQHKERNSVFELCGR